MPNIGSILKDEIKRLSRRTGKVFFSPLKRDLAKLKSIVTEQRGAIQRLERDNARLIADLNSRIAHLPEVPQEEAAHARISPRLILAQRKRLRLSQEELGHLLGVSGHTIFLWEHDKARPRAKVKAALAAVRHLGRREAREMLKAMASVNGGGHGASRKI